MKGTEHKNILMVVTEHKDGGEVSLVKKTSQA